MLNQIPHSRRLAIFLSGIWLFVSGLFSLMIGAEEFFVEYDPTAAFLTTWLFVGVMPLGLVWGAAWVVGGYRLERRQVAMREPEPGEGLRPQGIGSLEGGGTVTRLRVLLAQHPAWTLVGGVVVVVAVAIGLIPPGTSPIEYKTGFGEAFVYALTSPVHAFAGAIGTLVFARVFVAPWQRYWVGYRATLLAQLWTGAVSMLGWTITAAADSEMAGMAVTLLLVFPGVAWVFGRFLKLSDGNPIGLLVGAKILALGLAATLVLLGVVALVLGVALT